MRQKTLIIGFLLLLCACEKHKLNQHDPIPNKAVHYQLDGKKYSIPLGYHWDAYIKYKRWPEPKESYTTVDYISFTALLPGLSPMTETNYTEFDTRGFGEKVSVLLASERSRPKPLAEIVNTLKNQNQLVRLEDDVEGLSHFADMQRSDNPDKWLDMYFRADAQGDFWIQCVRGVPFPSCDVFHSKPGTPFIKYWYSRKSLEDWRSIDDSVLALLNSFQVKA